MKTKIDSLQMKLQINQKYFMALASEKDLPLKRYGFELKKNNFVTAYLSGTAFNKKILP